MARTLEISMLPYNWRKSFDHFEIKMLRLMKLSTDPAPSRDDTNPLHIVMGSEYMFRRNPMTVVNDSQQSFFIKNDTSPQVASNTVNWYGQKHEHTIHSQAERDEMIQRMCTVTAGKNIMIVAGSIVWAESEPMMSADKKKVLGKGDVLNSTYIIHNGSLVFDYDKHDDAAEIDYYEQKLYSFKPGTNGGAFSADGLNFGIEICADHGMIRRGFQDSGTASNLDVHLLISDGVAARVPAVRDGGCLLQCDRSIGKVFQTAGTKRNQIDGVDNKWTVTLP